MQLILVFLIIFTQENIFVEMSCFDRMFFVVVDPFLFYRLIILCWHWKKQVRRCFIFRWPCKWRAATGDSRSECAATVVKTVGLIISTPCSVLIQAVLFLLVQYFRSLP